MRIHLAVAVWTTTLALSMVVPTLAHAEEKAWVAGKWEKTFDPDNDPKDFLVFDATGAVQVLNAAGATTYGGTYTVAGPELALSIHMKNNRLMTIRLQASDDHKRLLFTSTRPGTHPATYERVK